MSLQLNKNTIVGRRYALCVGIGQYTELTNRNLRYAVSDAQASANLLKDPNKGNFEVILLTETAQTTKNALDEALDKMLNAPDLNSEDIVVIYLSCHGNVYGNNKTFYILPSNARLEVNGMPKKTSVIDIYDLTKTLSGARARNIIFLLDACYSGGAGGILRQLNLDLDLTSDTNLFIIGAARHDQVAFQASNIHHGVFTHCLLQSFEQKPIRNDGWLTISEIHSFVTEEIKAFKEESPLQIQGVSASVNPNLPFTKNPHYSPQSMEFHKEVKKLLQLVQYEPVDIDVPKSAPAGFYVAEIRSGLRTHHVGIISHYNHVEPLLPEHAQTIARFVKEQVKKGNLYEGLLVTVHEASEEVKSTILKHGGRYLEVRTYESVWKNLIDFRKYLHKLVHDYENPILEQSDDPPLAQVYIPLNAERRHYKQSASSDGFIDTILSEISRKEYQVTWQGDLEEYVKDWLSDPTSSRLALLAEYGSGKSTFCQHMAVILAKAYLEAKELGRFEDRLPILIPLLDFAKAPVDLESYLVSQLKRHCKVDNPDFDALMKMAEAGLFLFLLDGFDEMASRATNDTVYQNIALFERLANLPRNKVLLTTLPEYFVSLSQELQVLYSYPSLHLQPFNKEQIDCYLQKRVPFIKPREGELPKDWNYYRQQISNIHDLSDLVQRPVLLEMIIKTLPVLVTEGKAINRPNLYQHYLEGELDRQLRKQRRDLSIDRQKRFEIMERVALELYRTDKAELPSRKILEVSKELLSSEQQGELEGSLREILTCSFLIRIGNEYRFSHQSFLEYLVACRLAKDITDDKRENFRLKPISRTIQGFLLELEFSTIQSSLGTPNTANIKVSFDYTRLERWFKSDPLEKWTSTNAVSLLARLLNEDLFCKLPLQNADLTSADLTSVVLRDANLSNTILRDADLSGADLRGVNLRRANLQGANLQYTDLRNADLQNLSLNSTYLISANLSGANLRSTDLSSSVLKNALLHSTNLQYAVLRDADLTNTAFNNADLSSADLRGANLSGANLSGAVLNDADLRGANLGGTVLDGADLRGANSRGTIYNNKP